MYIQDDRITGAREVAWSPLKSERLKRTRGVSFEEIISGRLLDIRKHPRRENQKIFVLEYKGYIWAVPYVMMKDKIFLKTLYPSRRLKKIYKKRWRHEKN